ncbi:unnamed protein product [Mucor fragilis]
MDRKKDVFFLVDQSTRSPDTNRINHEKVKIQLIPKKKIPTLGNPSRKNLLLSSGGVVIQHATRFLGNKRRHLLGIRSLILFFFPAKLWKKACEKGLLQPREGTTQPSVP